MSVSFNSNNNNDITTNSKQIPNQRKNKHKKPGGPTADSHPKVNSAAQQVINNQKVTTQPVKKNSRTLGNSDNTVGNNARGRVDSVIKRNIPTENKTPIQSPEDMSYASVAKTRVSTTKTEHFPLPPDQIKEKVVTAFKSSHVVDAFLNIWNEVKSGLSIDDLYELTSRIADPKHLKTELEKENARRLLECTMTLLQVKSKGSHNELLEPSRIIHEIQLFTKALEHIPLEGKNVESFFLSLAKSTENQLNNFGNHDLTVISAAFGKALKFQRFDRTNAISLFTKLEVEIRRRTIQGQPGGNKAAFDIVELSQLAFAFLNYKVICENSSMNSNDNNAYAASTTNNFFEDLANLIVDQSKTCKITKLKRTTLSKLSILLTYLDIELSNEITELKTVESSIQNLLSKKSSDFLQNVLLEQEEQLSKKQKMLDKFKLLNNTCINEIDSGPNDIESSSFHGQVYELIQKLVIKEKNSYPWIIGITNEHKVGPFCLDILLHEKCKFAVEVNGPHHLLINETLRKFLLEKLGWKIIEISNQEWQNQVTEPNKKKLIESKLAEFYKEHVRHKVSYWLGDRTEVPANQLVEEEENKPVVQQNLSVVKAIQSVHDQVKEKIEIAFQSKDFINSFLEMWQGISSQLSVNDLCRLISMLANLEQLQTELEKENFSRLVAHIVAFVEIEKLAHTESWEKSAFDITELAQLSFAFLNYKITCKNLDCGKNTNNNNNAYNTSIHNAFLENLANLVVHQSKICKIDGLNYETLLQLSTLLTYLDIELSNEIKILDTTESLNNIQSLNKIELLKRVELLKNSPISLEATSTGQKKDLLQMRKTLEEFKLLNERLIHAIHSSSSGASSSPFHQEICECINRLKIKGEGEEEDSYPWIISMTKGYREGPFCLDIVLHERCKLAIEMTEHPHLPMNEPVRKYLLNKLGWKMIEISGEEWKKQGDETNKASWLSQKLDDFFTRQIYHKLRYWQ